MPVLRSRQGVTFAVLALAVASFTLLQSLVVPVLATIRDHYGADQVTVTWVLTAYLLSASICTPLLGRIGDAVGKRRMMVVTLSALAIGSVAAALAPTIGVLIAARVLQGLGGGVLPLSFGIIRDEFDSGMGTALSVIASLAAVGFGIGIVLAGPIVGLLGFTWLFWLPAIATVIAGILTALVIPESPVRRSGRLPVLPTLLLAGWLMSLLLGLSQGNVWGWGSARVLGLFVAAVVLLVLWVRVEWRAPVPMIDMRMMRRRGVWTANMVGGFVGFGMFASFGFLPQLLQAPRETGYGFGASVSESGHMLVPAAIGSFLMGFVTARLVGRFGARAVITTGLSMTTVAFASIALWHSAPWQIYAATTVQGIGSGLVFSSLAGVVVGAVPSHQTGVASGMNANIRTIGGALGSAVMAGVVATYTLPSGLPAETGYVIGFWVLAGGTLLACVAARFIPNPEFNPVETRSDPNAEPVGQRGAAGEHV